MASEFKITTTGTPTTVVFNDLGSRSFTHPVVDYDLYQEFSVEEIAASADVQAAIDAGEITVTNEHGDSISDVLETGVVVKEISQTNTVSTTSATLITVPNMIYVIPKKGNYLILFGGRARHTDKDGGGRFAIFNDGAIVQRSNRRVNHPGDQGTDGYMPSFTHAYLVNVQASDVIDVRYARTQSPGSIEFTDRVLTIIKL